MRHKKDEPDLIIRLPDGSQALIAVDLTDYRPLAKEDDATRPSVLLDWAGLRQMANLVARLKQRAPSSEE